MTMGIERLNTSVECLQRDSTNHICPFAESFRLNQRPDSICRHELRAVQQRQTFLGLQADRFPTHFFPYILAFAALPFVVHFAHADERQAEVCQRSQVARGAQGALLVNNGQDVVVEHIDEALYGH